MTYGIANRSGRPAFAEIGEMLRFAYVRGVRLVDTARAYGEAEGLLGAQGAATHGFQIVTKTAPLRVGQANDEQVRGITAGFDESLASLGCQRVYGLLVHRVDALLTHGGERIWAALEEIKSTGRVGRIGVSVYHPRQLERILDRYPIELVQLPFSVYDQRFAEQGLLRQLRQRQIEVHARSVFLQGVLLLPAEQLPSHLESLRAHQSALHTWFRSRGLTVLEGCLRFCLQQPAVGRVVIGCETANQLKEILDASGASTALDASDLAGYALDNEAIVNPSLWEIQGPGRRVPAL